MKRDSSPFEGK